MKIVLQALVFTVFSTPAFAERVSCEFSPPCNRSGVCLTKVVPLQFVIDHNQFAPAHDASEPPRNKVTHVAFGDMEFAAEPIVMADMRGFWALVDGVEHLMTVRSDGRATYATTGPVPFMSGQCEVTR